jgi:hypothetical protein
MGQYVLDTGQSNPEVFQNQHSHVPAAGIPRAGF